MLRLDRRGAEVAGGRGLHHPLHAAAQGQHLEQGQYRALRGAEGRGTDDRAGERAYEENKHKSGLYAYERQLAELSAEDEALFRKNKAAWADWEKRPPGYRKVVLHWVTSAKKPEDHGREAPRLS